MKRIAPSEFGLSNWSPKPLGISCNWSTKIEIYSNVIYSTVNVNLSCEIVFRLNARTSFCRCNLKNLFAFAVQTENYMMKCVCRLRITGWRGQKFRLMYTWEICSGNIFIRRIFNCRINLRRSRVKKFKESRSEVVRITSNTRALAWNSAEFIRSRKTRNPNARCARAV